MDASFDLSSQSGAGVVINDSLVLLNKAWCTETNALEILPFKADIVEELQAQLIEQQNSIDQKIEDAVEHEYFVVSLYQMDIERVRYSLARYFRTRLLKIERNLEYILSNIDVMDRLSMSEKEFATKIQRLNDRHFEENVSNRFEHVDAREYYESTENRLRNAQPPEKNFVFCRALADIRDLPVSVDQNFTVWKGDICILQYSMIRDFVNNGTAELL